MTSLRTLVSGKNGQGSGIVLTMGIELARKFIEEEDSQSCCVSSSLHALLEFEPDPRTVEALSGGSTNETTCIRALTDFILLEYLEAGVSCFTNYLEDNEKPSRLFRRSFRNASHGSPMSIIGGLMLTNDARDGEGHVVAITSFHDRMQKGKRRGKVTIWDTFPYPKSTSSKAFARKVSLDWLDRRIIDPELTGGQPRAVAITGIPIMTLEVLPEFESQFVPKFNKLHDVLRKAREAFLRLREEREVIEKQQEKERWLTDGFRSKKAFRRARRMTVLNRG